MAPSRLCHDCSLNIVAIITMTFIFSTTVVLFLTLSGESERLVQQQQRKTVLGSKPPGCVNKCLNCRPCMATLVIPNSPQSQWKTFKSAAAAYHGDKDDAYYLLLWKCKCGDKLFQP